MNIFYIQKQMDYIIIVFLCTCLHTGDVVCLYMYLAHSVGTLSIHIHTVWAQAYNYNRTVSDQQASLCCNV